MINLIKSIYLSHQCLLRRRGQKGYRSVVGCHLLGVEGQDGLDIAQGHVVAVLLVEEDPVEEEQLFALEDLIAGVYRLLAALAVIAL